jgi:hypothetical protein
VTMTKAELENQNIDIVVVMVCEGLGTNKRL